MPIEYYLQLTLYNLYPEKFQKYIEMASKSKWNVEKSTYSMSGKIPTFGVKNDWMTTNRIYFFRRIISYYKNNSDSRRKNESLNIIIESIIDGINPNLVELKTLLDYFGDLYKEWHNGTNSVVVLYKFPKIREYLKSILQTKTKSDKILKKYESFQYLKNFSNYKN